MRQPSCECAKADPADHQTSLLRALSPSTPTILCPAMNTHMYQHPLTADHLRVAQDKLGYMVLGPQGAGRLACGDEGGLRIPLQIADTPGPGKMTDWREIVLIIQDFAAMYRSRATTSSASPQAIRASAPAPPPRSRTPPTPIGSPRDSQMPPVEVPPQAVYNTFDFSHHAHPSSYASSAGTRLPADEAARTGFTMGADPAKASKDFGQPPLGLLTDPLVTPAVKPGQSFQANFRVGTLTGLAGAAFEQDGRRFMNGSGGDESPWAKHWWIG